MVATSVRNGSDDMPDLHLVGQDYSWAGSILSIGVWAPYFPSFAKN